jgi:hypothetical protein
MKVYEVIKDCTISYTSEGEDHGGFVLYKGDLFFIKPDFCWVKKESRLNHESPYSKKSLLVKIYHNKLVWFGDKVEDKKYEWTWIENINIIDPIIEMEVIGGASGISNYGWEKDFDKLTFWNTTTGQPVLKDVTSQWEREEKLNELLNIEKK